MIKSATRAVRAQVNAAASAFGSAALSDIVRMFAGHTEAKQDVIASAVYTAYFNALKHGNKSQLQGRESSLLDQAKMYASDTKACKAAGFPQPKKAATLYAAHLSALTIVGVPGKATVQDLVDEEGNAVSVEQHAERVSFAYMDALQNWLDEADGINAERTAKAQATRAAKQAEATKGAAAAVAEAEQLAEEAKSVPAVDISAMIAAVAAALRTGAISDDDAAVLAEAADEYNQLAKLRTLVHAGDSAVAGRPLLVVAGDADVVPPALAAMALASGDVAHLLGA